MPGKNRASVIVGVIMRSAQKEKAGELQTLLLVILFLLLLLFLFFRSGLCSRLRRMMDQGIEYARGLWSTLEYLSYPVMDLER